MVNDIQNLQTTTNFNDKFHKNFSSRATVNIVSNFKVRTYLNRPSKLTI